MNDYFFFSAPQLKRDPLGGAGVRLEEMKEPTLEFVGYRVVFAPGVALNTPAPLPFDTPQFHGVLTQDALELRPKVRFSTEAEARAAVEPLLRAWEVKMGLDAGAPVLSFEFGIMRFVDGANPSGSGFGLDHRTVHLGADALLVHSLKAFPSPPTRFASTPDIETLWARYKGYKDRREPLQSMAYFCFTVLTAPNGVDAAARDLHTDKEVLRKVSEVSTNTGDRKSARKQSTRLRPATAAERRWLEGAILALINQLGQLAAGAVPQQLRMKSLPPL